jgi:protein phosphatase
MLRLASAAASHPGLRRDQNEDAYCLRPDLGLYLVADGMGGHAAGEVASRIAVDTIQTFIARSAGWTETSDWPLPFDAARDVAANRLRISFHLANHQLATASAADGDLRGMATTASAVLADEDRVLLGHVGDSRIYLWHDGTLRQLTSDHSWVGDRVRAGILTESDARQHPWRNVVTRALSGGDDPDVDIVTAGVGPGDSLLLCSDGLSGVVADDTMGQVLGNGEPLEAQCRALIDAANEAGGPDNITVAVLRVHVE